jgi:hypothetical protein
MDLFFGTSYIFLYKSFRLPDDSQSLDFAVGFFFKNNFTPIGNIEVGFHFCCIFVWFQKENNVRKEYYIF